MGIFLSCCRPSASEVMTPDAETRRRQQTEAAERRRAEEEARGIKDPTKVLRTVKKYEEMERRKEELAREGGATLKWSQD